MQRLRELEAANLPPDFFKEERERREHEREKQALQEQTDEAVMAAKQAELKAHEAEVRREAGIRRRSLRKGGDGHLISQLPTPLGVRRL